MRQCILELVKSSSLVLVADLRFYIPNFAEIRVLRCDSSKVVAKPKFRNNLVRLDGQESSLLLYSKDKSRFRVNATAGQPEAFDANSKQKSFRDSLDAFYRFSRPHTVIGTVKFLLRNESLLTAIFRGFQGDNISSVIGFAGA